MHKLPYTKLAQLGALFAVVLMGGVIASRARAEETATTPAPAATTPAVNPFALDLEGVVASTDIDGNRRRFEQYVTPANGLYLGLLHFTSQPPGGKSLFDLGVRNLGVTNTQGDLFSLAGYGQTVIEGSLRQSRFFRDFSAIGEPLRRQDQSYRLIIPSKTGEAILGYKEVDLSGQSVPTPEDWRRQVASADYTRYVGKWRTHVGVANEAFSFIQGPQFSGDSNIVSLQASPPVSDRSSLEVSAVYTRLNLANFVKEQNVDRYRLAVDGSHALTRNLSVTGELSHDENSQPMTLNAYALRNTVGKVQAQYRGIRRTLLSAGGGIRRVGYLNSTETEVINSDINSVFLKASTRLSKQLQLKAGGTTWWTTNRPVGIDITNAPIGPLVWSSRRDLQAELSYAPSWRTGVTAGVRNKSWSNVDESTKNSVDEQIVTAWWMPADRLTLYSNYLVQDFGLQVPLLDVPSITNSKTFTLGGTYQWKPSLALDLSYSNSDGSGATIENQHGLAFGLDYTMPSKDELAIRIGFDNFDSTDEASALNYAANRFEIRYTKVAF